MSEMPKQRVVFASGNTGKARELKALFAELFGETVELLLQGELGVESVEETGTTFEDNAVLKARHAAAATGLPSLADDSGIEVDALGGEPGVYSARYAGAQASDQDNVRKLLEELGEVEGDARSARFRCVLAYVRDAADAEPLLASGSWEGIIASEPSGKGGFGYDPVFIDGASGQTAAELPPGVKNARSHRGKAMNRMRELLGASGL